MTQGFFITFEGPEGSGKTTQIKLLKDFLISRGHQVITTHEPGGTIAGDKIRAVLLDNDCGHLEPETELFLMLAQRSEHLRKVILPALEKGQTVICDRYYDSSMAYQGHGRGIKPEKITRVHSEFLPGFLPDYTVLLQINPEQGLERAKHGGQKKHDRMESQDLEFHMRVSAGYSKLAEDEPERFIVISADGAPEAISSRIIDGLKSRCADLAD